MDCLKIFFCSGCLLEVDHLGLKEIVWKVVWLVLVGSGLLFLQAFDAFAFESRDEAAVAGVAGGWFLTAVLPLVDEVGFVDQGAAERD